MTTDIKAQLHLVRQMLEMPSLESSLPMRPTHSQREVFTLLDDVYGVAGAAQELAVCRVEYDKFGAGISRRTPQVMN